MVEWWEVDVPSRLRVQAEFLRGFLWRGKYEFELARELVDAVGQPKQKDQILELTTNLVVEWMTIGFSRDYIYAKAKAFFFGVGGVPIKESTQLNNLLEMLTPKEKKFDVCFRVAAAWNSLTGSAFEDMVEILRDSPTPRAGLPLEKRFLQKPHVGSYAIFRDIEAFDARSACNHAFRLLKLLAEMATCHAHRRSFKVETEVLVWEASHPLVLGRPIPAIFKEDECPADELSDRLSKMIQALGPGNMPNESWERFGAAFGLHSSALLSNDVGVQLSSLWAAFEALLPATGDDSKIATVTDAVVPTLCRFYMSRLLEDLAGSLTVCCPIAFSKAKTEANISGNELTQLAGILAIESCEPQRDQIYRALNANPLLRHRVYLLKRSLESSASIMQLIIDHAQRVSWQLRRIYRNRNLLLHTGQSLPYRDVLVENLHAYFHEFVHSCESLCAQSPAPSNLDAALLRLRMDYEAHLNCLKDAKKAPTELATLRSFVFGER
jgi:hypothetical protein